MEWADREAAAAVGWGEGDGMVVLFLAMVHIVWDPGFQPVNTVAVLVYTAGPASLAPDRSAVQTWAFMSPPPDTTAAAPGAAGAGSRGGTRRALKPGSFRPLDLSTLMFASAVTGVAVTAIMRDVGTPAWVVMAACTFAFSGTGEVAYASVIASGGGMAPALLAAMLVSSRFGLLAMSMTGRWPAPLWERVAVAHFSSEVAVAAAIEQRPAGPDAARRAFWQLAMSTTTGWIIGSGIGLVLGQLGDTRRIGLDVVFPASFVGAVVNALRQRDSTVAVLLGALAALALTPVLPA
ncbi:MAG: AzlC family ABC transporter permease, partial [Acidimicrobiia bacterium]|nr:AzlC family ABC transporter permease [Acidimicrobiia bacterium]